MGTTSVSDFLMALGRSSAEAGILIILVLGVQWFFRKRLTPRWQCALWLLVVIRLLLPFSLSSATSVFNLLPRWTRPEPTGSTVVAPPTSPASASPTSFPRSIAYPENQVKEKPPVAQPPNPTIATPSPSWPSAEAVHHYSWSWPVFIFGVWLAGVFLLAGCVLVSSLRLWRCCSKLKPLTQPEALTVLKDCCERLKLRTRLALVEGVEVSSPALHGVIRPRLLLPKRFAEKFSPTELRFVFLHELAHLKRRDLLLNWVIALLQIAHWFNPLVWLGFARWRADRELACDAIALEAVGAGQNKEYGRTILRLLENFTRPLATPGLVGILEDKRQLRRRIGMIANYVPARGWPRLAMVLVAVLAVIGLTDAQTHSKSSKNSSSGLASSRSTGLTGTNFHTIRVTVLDAKTGHPVPEAGVAAPYLAGWNQSHANHQRMRTDKRGVVVVEVPRLPDSRMQNFSIEVSATNYPARAAMWISDPGNVLATLPDQYIFRLKKGITIGGFVLDERGQPVAGATVIPWGSGYRGFSMGTGRQFHQEYPEASRYGVAGAVTDDRGFWKESNFPADLTAVRIDVVRPGGARSQFSTEAGEQLLTVEPATTISLSNLLSTNVVLKLKDGYNIRGVVVNQAGTPIPGVHLKARGGRVNQTPVYSFTNNPDGRFALMHWTVSQFVLTAEADGYATRSVVMSSKDSAAEKRLVLAPAKALRVRVLGERNEPVAGARLMIIDWRSGNQLLNWHGVTDGSGRVVWTNAPDQPVSFWIRSTNYPVRAVTLLADGTEKIVHLRAGSDKSISIHLKVTDARSGRPLPRFDVWRDLQWNQSFSRWENASSNGEFRAQIALSEFRLGIVDSYKLQVRADGYLLWSSGELYFDEGDQNLTANLVKGASPTGVVLQPDGQPAVDARVILKLGDGAVFANAPDRYYPGQGSVVQQTGKDGSFHLESADDDKYLVITHPTGFASITVGELHQAKEVRLQPWASVQGVLQVNGKPLANEYVDVKSPVNWYDLEGYNLVFTKRTDSKGHFTFTNLPPGDYVLYRTPHIIYGVATTESHRWPFDLKPGEVKHIVYTFHGRSVTGHVETDSPVDWHNDPQVLAAKTSPPPPAPSYWSYVDTKAYDKARRAYAHSPEMLAYERKQQQFQLVFDNDGNFQADDVPPGTYELRLRVTKPPTNSNARFSGREEELGSLVREVRVPAGNGTFDLGSFAMAIRPSLGQALEPARPVELKARTLDGKPFDLAQFRGRYALLVFWSLWSDRCTEELATLRKLQVEMNSNKRIAFVDINLDDNLETVRQTVKTRGYSGEQVWLDGTNLAKASARFGISSLPSICLVGPDGHVMARNLLADNLHTALQRVLRDN